MREKWKSLGALLLMLCFCYLLAPGEGGSEQYGYGTDNRSKWILYGNAYGK